MKKVYFLFAVLLAPIVALHGQEKIESIFKMYGEHSIIREINDGKWMVCSDNGSPKFLKVEDGVSNVDVLLFPNEIISVSDFVIYRNAVYFCGKLRNGVPTMGHFSLSSFPTSTVYYSEMTNVDTLIAIQVMDYEASGSGHVVMIGRQNDVGILVDAMPTTNGWDTYYILLLTKQNNYTVHTDLAITDGHVVVTSYNTKIEQEVDMDTLIALAQGYIWFIDRPVSAGTSLAASTPYYIHVPDIKRNSPFIVADREGDACVAATVAFVYNGISYVPGINVYDCTGASVTDKVRIKGITSIDMLRDICYDSLSRTTELLTLRRMSNVDESRIYTLKQGLQRIVKGHRYPDQRLNSLINQSQNSNLFIGSGIDIRDEMNLYLYRYNNTDTGTCTHGIECPVEELECEKCIEGKTVPFHSLREVLSVSPGNMDTDINTTCEYEN
ncbi:MAG: hypothetical protein IKP21_08605 [Bacteroidales bacterium]|nr:hypothetical protein [Bacteroidales bacterium]